MINKQAVQEFLNRQLDDNSWIKETKREELEQAISEICSNYKMKNKLFTHQLASVYLGLCFPGYLFFLDMGSGKSLSALTVLQIRKNLNQVKSALVVVPNAVNVENWLEEVLKHSTLKAVALVGTRLERLATLQEKADLYIINYEGLPVLMTDFVEVKKGSKSKKKRVVNKVEARKFAKRFDMVIFDEIHHIKHTNTLNFELAEVLSTHINYRLGMTGTPIGRDPTNFWAQFFVIDRGETLGETKTLHLQALFKPQQNYFGGVTWILPEKNKPVFQKMLLHRSLRYADFECSDLPPLSVIQVPLKMPADAMQYYKNLVAESVETAKGDSAEAKEKRKNYYSKCRQVASGFVYETFDDSETREVITFSENPKLDAMEEIVNDIPADCKVVIFHVFQQTGIAICERLKKMKVKFAAMNNLAEISKTEEYKKFKTDPKVKALVVSISSGGEGLNLQLANYTIFLENTDRPDVRRQALKRTHRTGQEKHVYIYDLIMKNTVELKILQFIEEGKCLFNALVEGSATLE